MYPPAPWHLRGSMWLSLFRVREGDRSGHFPGVHAVALVHYDGPGPLEYDELLVARPVREPARAVTVEQAWVDSEESREGGRELWAIPKEVADFSLVSGRGALVSHARWTVSAGGEPIVEARFSGATRLAPRLPFAVAAWQPGLGAGERTSRASGSARSLVCRAHWEFAPGGPLGWLSGKRPLASFALADLRMSFA